MNRLAIAAWMLCLDGGLLGQSALISPASRYSTTEGSSYSFYFGGLPQMRIQMADGNLRNSVRVISSLAYRPDYTYHMSYDATGRSWSSVTIDMADTDLQKMGKAFSLNLKSSKTRVFSSSVSWPTLTGKPPVKPAQWSLMFPFKQNWLSMGKRDALADFCFDGGRLVNGAVWQSNRIRLYYLDSWSLTSHVSGEPAFHNAEPGCSDARALPPFTKAYTWLHVDHYSGGYFTTSYRNRIRTYFTSYFTAPGKPVTHVVDFAGHAGGGVPLGDPCQRLFLQLTSQAWFFSLVADGVGKARNYCGLADGLLPVHPALLGKRMWVQGAWNDSATGALKLTAACSVEIPALPGFGLLTEARRRMVYSCSTCRPYGPEDHYFFNPITKYN